MTFQRRTAHRLIVRIIARSGPTATIVVGGYDPSLATEAYEAVARRRLHRPRRGRSHVPRAAARARAAAGADVDADIAGLSFGARRRFVHNPTAAGQLARRRRRAPAEPRARVLTATRSSAGRSTSSRPRAAAPTTAASARSSRCAAATSTRGRSSACWPTSPTRARRGARAIFIVDDNITLNVARFEALCRAIVDAGLNDIDYIVQAMTSSIADHGETLAPLMRRPASATCSSASRTSSTRTSRS